MSEVMIETTGLAKRYGEVQALDDVNMQVHRGEVLGFLGPNGAGKTTTMKILTCFTAPTSGSARVNGYDIFDESLSVRASIGYLPEHTPLYLNMDVLEYLHFVAEMRGIEGDHRARVKSVVETVGLTPMFAREIRTLSKGFRQRVGLAQALIHEPPILILDEPMSGLDPNQAAEIRDLIREIGKERTIILSTHNLAEVQATCTRVLIISHGKLVADDTPEQLSERAGRSRYLVSVQRDGHADAEQLQRVFSGVAGVGTVRALDGDDGEITLELLPEHDEDLRALAFKAAVDNNLTLLGLRRESQGLEQVFRTLTTSDMGDGSPPPTNESQQPPREDEAEQPPRQGASV